MLTFYLIRHGLKESVPPLDPALTNLGVKQAEATAAYLKTISFQAIIASLMNRTKQTAEIVANEIRLPIVTDERLIERMEWEQKQSLDEFLTEWNKTDKDRSYVPSLGESSNNKGKQMREVVDELSEKYSDGNILIVSHGGAIGDLLRNLFDEKDLPHVTNPLSGVQYIDILECSITIVEKENNKHRLVKTGDISHLSIPLT